MKNKNTQMFIIQKSISILLSICMMLTFFGMSQRSVFAEEENTESGPTETIEEEIIEEVTEEVPVEGLVSDVVPGVQNEETQVVQQNDVEQEAIALVSEVNMLYSSDSTASHSSSPLLDLTDKEPLNFANADDPYGFGVGVPFLLNEEKELFTFHTWNGNRALTVYDTLKNNVTTTETFNSNNFKSVQSWELGTIDNTTLMILNNFNFVKAVAFDPNGTGRKTHVGFVGVYENPTASNRENSKYVYVIIYDVKNHIWSGHLELGRMNWMTDSTDYYKGLNFLSITAGDYNGDKKDSLIVYAALDYAGGSTTKDNGAYGLFEINVNDLSMSFASRTPSKDPLNYDYVGNANPILNDSNNSDGREKLICTLDTGDVNNDGIDDLVVLSYTDDVGNDYDDYPYRYIVPFLCVQLGSPTKSVLTGRGPNAFVQGDPNENKYPSMRMADVTVVNTDGSGGDEIVVAGKYCEIEKDNSGKLKGWNFGDYLNMAKYSWTGNGIAQAFITNQALELNAFTQYGMWTNTHSPASYDHVWPMIPVQGVYMNGVGNPGYVFVGGDIYDVSTAPQVIYKNEYFTEADLAANQGAVSLVLSVDFISSVAVGNFDGNERGYQQVVYNVGRKENGNDYYVFSYGVVGIDSSKRDNETGLPTDVSNAFYSTDKEHHEAGYSIFNANDDFHKTLNCVVVGVDVDNDGVLARYNRKNYTYSDPDVLAVLQAAPYYKVLNDNEYYTDCQATSYTLEEETSYTRGSSNSVSFGVGGVVNMEGTIGGIELKGGYALDWTESFEKTLSYSVSQTWTAQNEDSIILYRTPVFTYIYDIYQNGNWVDEALAVSTVNMPVYQQLSLKDYNLFVDEYNAKMASKTSTFTPMVKLDAESCFLDICGNPFAYPSAANKTYGDLHALGYSSSADTISSEFSVEEAKTTEEAHGFSFEMTATFGFDGGFVSAGAGPYASLEYQHGTSTTYSSGKGIGYEGSVQNIMGSVMEEDGYSMETIRSYGFNWQLGVWDSNIYAGKDDNGDDVYVPVVGFVLKDVKALPEPPENVTVDPIDEDLDGNIDRLHISWEDAYDETSGYPKADQFVVYLVTDDDYSRITETEDLECDFEALDGRTTYKFVVRGIYRNMSETLDSEPGYRFLDAYTVGIQSIDLTNHDGLKDIYTITMTDGTKRDFTVTNGNGIKEITKTDTTELVDTYTITMSDGSVATFTVTNGDKGVGITSIAKTDTKGDKDIYTITLGDGTSYEFTVINGKNGNDGKDGINGINGSNGSNGTNGTNGVNGTNGINGVNGQDGKDGTNVTTSTVTEVPVTQVALGSMTSAEIDGSGNLIFTFADGTQLKAGVVKGDTLYTISEESTPTNVTPSNSRDYLVYIALFLSIINTLWNVIDLVVGLKKRKLADID